MSDPPVFTMQAGASQARKPRAHYRHEMRTLTYVTLDDGNGGIVRNLNHEGIAVQAVARLHPEQRVRMRFELRFPRLRVDAYGEVTWANASGQCGVRFLELPMEVRRKIDEWIFSSLLESLAHDRVNGREMFDSLAGIPSEKSPQAIAAGPSTAMFRMDRSIDRALNGLPQFQDESFRNSAWFQWLRLPHFPHSLSPRGMAWLLDGLVMMAALLVFALIFLCIAEEVPRWGLGLSALTAATVLVVGSYCGLFFLFGEASLGTRLVDANSARKERVENEVEEFFR